MGGIGSGGYRHGAGRKTIDGEPRERISVTLPAWMLVQIRDEAWRRHISVSALVTELVERGLG